MSYDEYEIDEYERDHAHPCKSRETCAKCRFMRLLHYANKGRVKTQGGWVFPEWFAVPQAQTNTGQALERILAGQ